MLLTCSSNGQGRSNGFVRRIVLHMLALLKTILFIIMSVSEYGNGVLGVLHNARLTMTGIEHLRFFNVRVEISPDPRSPAARATTVASILYATPAWWGIAGEGNRLRLERLKARMRRGGYFPSDFRDIASLAEEADRRLFKSIIQCQTHVLRHLFIDKPTSTRSLRVREHNFILLPSYLL